MADTQLDATLSASEPISGNLSANEGISAGLTPNEEVSGSLEVKRTRSVPYVLNDLGDVSVDDPQDGDELVYDAEAGEWVNGAGAGGGVWGTITGTLSNQTDLQAELDKKVITLTKLQYDALTPAEKNDPDKVYYVTDYEAEKTWVLLDDNDTASDKVWSSEKIDAELATTTRLDDSVVSQDKSWSSSKISSELSGKYDVGDTVEISTLANDDTFPFLQHSSSGRRRVAWATIIAKIKSLLATVATSGSYNDLTNKPTIPAAQVNSNWNATSGVAQILNKPDVVDNLNSTSGTDALSAKQGKTLNDALGKTIRTMTKAQYDALSASEKADLSNVFYVTDYEAPRTWVLLDDSSEAADKVWSASKIKSYIQGLLSDFVIVVSDGTSVTIPANSSVSINPYSVVSVPSGYVGKGIVGIYDASTSYSKITINEFRWWNSDDVVLGNQGSTSVTRYLTIEVLCVKDI